MQQPWRLFNEQLTGDLAFRAVGLIVRWIAIVIGMVVAAWQQDFSQAAWTATGLTLLALLVVLPLTENTRSLWPALVEMSLAGLVLSFGPVFDTSFLPYLMVAATYWGVRGGAGVSLAGVALAALTLLLPQSFTSAGISATTLGAITQWLGLAALGALVGGWSRSRQSRWQSSPQQYRDAYQLLLELREVTRRLPAALDETSASSRLVSELNRLTSFDGIVVMRIDSGGPPLPVISAGLVTNWHITPDDPMVQEMRASNRPVQSYVWVGAPDQPTEDQRAHRVMFPLRVGGMTIGLVALQRKQSWSPAELRMIDREVEADALMLETSFVFSDIRTLATTEERSRLAREIHDGVAQEIAGMAYAIDDVIARAPSELTDDLAAIRGELTRVVSELRLSIFELRSHINPGAGLGASVAEYVREIGRRSGLTVHIELEEIGTRFTPDVEVEVLRIAQEAVTNARRHANARNIWLTLRSTPPSAVLRIADDGIGLGKKPNEGYGLAIMRERAERIGGTLVARPRTGGGTVVELHVGSS